MLDVELVPINEHVKIASSNFRIAREKTRPDVIYKFWYTITYDLNAKAYILIMGDKVFEVNANLLCNALRITPKVPDHPFTLPAPEKEIISFTYELACTNVDFADLIYEEFKYHIESRRVSRQKQELMSFARKRTNKKQKTVKKSTRNGRVKENE
ncbi:hypothetical protein Tco_0436735 [Tanacetum coccineum]